MQRLVTSILNEEAKMAAKEVNRKTRSFVTSFKPPKHAKLGENIFRVILSSCRDETRRYFLSNPAETERLIGIIELYVQRSLPIPFSITFALFMRAKNIFKFSEWKKNVPHLGWIDFLGRLKYLDSKLRTIYEPGCKIFIFEEASLFHDVIGWRKEEVEKFKLMAVKIISGLELAETLVILPMSDLDLPTFSEWQSDGKKEAPHIEEPTIFAMMASCSEFRDQEIIDLLYKMRSRDYHEIKEKSSCHWEQAREKAAYVRSVMNIRKERNLWGKCVDAFYAERDCVVAPGNFLDAVITNKEGRLVLNMGGVFPNHGMAVVNGNKYSLENIPEYRIADAHPVKISDEGEEFTFFYEKK